MCQWLLLLLLVLSPLSIGKATTLLLLLLR